LRKILITGSSGQIGRELTQTLTSQDFKLITANRSQLDVSDYFQVQNMILEHRPDWVINCAAFTNLDLAEMHVAESNKINSCGPSLLAQACRITRSNLLHFSTDAVFSSNNLKFFSSKESTNPLSQYGKSKAMGEKLLLNNYTKNIWIIRSSWLYGIYGGRFVQKILESIRNRQSIQVVDDQFGQPTYTKNFGLHVKDFILDPPESGLYHFTDSGYTSRFDFAKHILLYLGIKDYDIVSKSTSLNNELAIRPKYSLLSLDNHSVKAGTRFTPWQESLNQFLKTQKI